jgi:hypothetical protein
MWSFISSFFFSMALPFNPRFFSGGGALGPKAVFYTLPSGTNWHCDCFVDFPFSLEERFARFRPRVLCSAFWFCATDSFKAATFCCNSGFTPACCEKTGDAKTSGATMKKPGACS